MEEDLGGVSYCMAAGFAGDMAVTNSLNADIQPLLMFSGEHCLQFRV